MKARLELQSETRPPHDASHGTADAMVWRQVRFDLPAGVAVFEQTDYGHPGRFNAWEPRELPAGLQARVGELATVAEQLSVLVT